MKKSEMREWVSHPMASLYRRFATEGKRRNKAQEYTGKAYLFEQYGAMTRRLYDERAFRRVARRYRKAAEIVMRDL